MYYVYVLYSPSHNRLYIGQTDNLRVRVARHNSGLVRSTRPYQPWDLIYFETFASRGEALRRERELKEHRGRQWIRSQVLARLLREKERSDKA